MAGMFNNGDKIRYNNTYYQYEYNVQMDIESAKHFIENTPTPIIFVDFLVGYKVLTMGPLLRQDDESNPITVAYKAFSGRPRESWDLIAVYLAARGCDDLFELSPKGTVTVSNQGETSFLSNPTGLHQYIRLRKNEKDVEFRLNQLVTDYLNEKGDNS
jgi:hypothetical protein